MENPPNRFASLLTEVARTNPFYRGEYLELLAAHREGREPSPVELAELPFTSKEDFVADQAAHSR